MQALKQRSDVDERIVASRTEAVGSLPKVVEEALVAAMEREISEREKAIFSAAGRNGYIENDPGMSFECGLIFLMFMCA